MEAFIAWIEKNIMPGANKLASERHLKAIRDTFMTILPPIFFGGIIAVINSAPVTDDTTNGILLAWAAFDQQNALVLGWLNQVTLGFLSLYVCIGITYYLAKSYEMEVFLPIIISLAGYCMLVIDPQEISFGNVLGQLTYFDGKGILVALFVSIMTVELYRVLYEHKVGWIKMPDSVPPALMVSFGSLVPCLIVLGIDSVIFILCKNITELVSRQLLLGHSRLRLRRPIIWRSPFLLHFCSILGGSSEYTTRFGLDSLALLSTVLSPLMLLLRRRVQLCLMSSLFRFGAIFALSGVWETALL